MKKIVSFLVGLVLLSQPALAETRQLFSNFYLFGDSLSDIGNVEDAPYTTPSINGARADLWVNRLANKLGLSINPSKDNGTDYAISGAISGPLPFTMPDSTFDVLNDQIKPFLQSHSNKIDSNALYSVWAGGNDIKNSLLYLTDPASVPLLINASTNNILTSVDLLHKAGAKYIMVSNLPDVGMTPDLSQAEYFKGVIYAQTYNKTYQDRYDYYIANNDPDAKQKAIEDAINAAQVAIFWITQDIVNIVSNLTSQLSSSYDDQLLSSLNAAGFEIIQTDIKGLFKAIQSSPEKFGFSSASSSYCYYGQAGDGSPALICQGDPERSVFYDGFHPSQKTGQIGADYFLSILEGPLYAAVLAEAPFSVMDNQNNSIHSELLSLSSQPLSVNSYKIFTNGIYHSQEVTENSLTKPKYQADTKTFTVGADYQFNSHTVIGAAIGHSINNIRYPHQKGGFDFDENVLSAFAGYEWKNLYLNTIFNYGLINYQNIKRKFMLGQLPETLTSNTTGEQYNLDANIGYYFISNQLKTGPIINFDYQKITVHPYAEKSSNFNSSDNNFDALQYDRQDNDSLTASIGWTISDTIPFRSLLLQPYLQATYNHQFMDNTRMVSAGVVTLPGSRFSLPIVTPNNDYALVNGGIKTTFANQMAITFGVDSMLGQTDTKAYSLLIGFSIPL